MFSFILFICLCLFLFQILRTYFFKVLLFIKFGRRLFFMKLCHSYLTFGIQLIFSHFVHLLFLSVKRIYSTNIIYLILLKPAQYLKKNNRNNLSLAVPAVEPILLLAKVHFFTIFCLVHQDLTFAYRKFFIYCTSHLNFPLYCISCFFSCSNS